MRRTVVIASNNMAAHLGHDQPDGLFADDRALADWLDRQLDHDATYLEAALERARDVGALVDQFVQRSQQRRQERFNLGLTGIIGAILMVLAGIQSLGYRAPVPESVQPAAVSALGAFALLASLVVLRVAVPERRWTWLAVCGASALLGASSGWLLAASLAEGSGSALTIMAGWVWGALGAAAGALVASAVPVIVRARG